MLKINRGISLSIMKGIFEPKAEHPDNLRCISQISAPLVSTVFISRQREYIFFRAKDLEPSSRIF